MYEVRFYKIKDGVLTYTVGSRCYSLTEAFQYYLEIEWILRDEYNFKPSIPDEKLEEVVRNSDKEVVTIINQEGWCY